MKQRLVNSGIIGSTTVLLLGMLLWGWAAPFRSGPAVETYFADVAQSIDDIPHQIGPWLGVDIPATPAAVELLKPNKLVQRRYKNTESGDWFELLFVHCGDVRDMIGHYPPVCYPAHGWTLDSKERIQVETEAVNTAASSYRLTRDEGLSKTSIRIINFFALPASKQPSFGPELDLIQQAGRYRERARLGAGQVQVITPDTMPDEQRREIVRIAMTLTEDVLRDIERGLQ